MRTDRGLTALELVILITVIAAAFVFGFCVHYPRYRDERDKTLCASRLSQLGKAMNLYFIKFDVFGSRDYPTPARPFRGDSWLAALYWSGLVEDHRAFHCPASRDAAPLPPALPSDLGHADAVPGDACSYAGLCSGLTGRFAHRNTLRFACATLPSSSVLACDDNEGPPHHVAGMNVVYYDTHVEFIAGPPAATYGQIGVLGSPYGYLDSGEP